MLLNVTSSICFYFTIRDWIRTVLSIVRLVYCSISPTYFCIFLDLRLVIFFLLPLIEMVATIFPCNLSLRTSANLRRKEKSSVSVADQILFRLDCNIFFGFVYSEWRFCVKIVIMPFDIYGLVRFRFWGGGGGGEMGRCLRVGF
jgi:hypothetical protein